MTTGAGVPKGVFQAPGGRGVLASANLFLLAGVTGAGGVRSLSLSSSDDGGPGNAGMFLIGEGVLCIDLDVFPGSRRCGVVVIGSSGIVGGDGGGEKLAGRNEFLFELVFSVYPLSGPPCSGLGGLKSACESSECDAESVSTGKFSPVCTRGIVEDAMISSSGVQGMRTEDTSIEFVDSLTYLGKNPGLTRVNQYSPFHHHSNPFVLLSLQPSTRATSLDSLLRESI